MKVHTSVSTLTPNAWIVNPSDRGRKSIKKDNKIYLEDGQEFQIEIFNPLMESVLADIRVNAKSISKTGLVLRPGERCYLDCFIDDKKKFIFKTYDVEDSQEAMSAISNNGTVDVFFYKEETLSLKNWINKYDRIIEKVYYPVYPQYPYINYGSTTGGNYLNNNFTYTTNSIIDSVTSDCKIGHDSFYSDTIGCESFTSKVETGRVQKGDISKQEFCDIDMEFQKYHISLVSYQILPESQRPLETKDIKKSNSEEIKSLKDEILELKKMIESLSKK